MTTLIEAAKQEPVAYDKTELNCFAQDLYDQKMREGKRGHYESMFHVIHQCVKKVATPPAAERQHHELLCVCGASWSIDSKGNEELLSTPPQRQPLTDERVWELAANCLDSVAGRLQFARAIEAAHGITGEKK